HPFMPFISEELWQLIMERKEGESIMVSELPGIGEYDKIMLESFENVKETVSGIRKIRKEKNIPNKDNLAISIQKGDKGYEEKFVSVLSKLGNLSSVKLVSEEVKGAASFRVKSTNYYIDLGGFVDAEAELKKLEEELKYTKGFLNSVIKKLSNERFVNNAPEAVVNMEKTKQADAEAKIKVLEERIVLLK
ncbi:MAG: class I tRNA ligase family protein, partial [Mariniphaga sp.]|nr:class I tRNA ligase family protein [Mariniphaga sp.]